MLTTIISFIIVLGVLIFFHEFGHYIMAKKAGIKVEEFALGWGPKLISHKKGETLYSIRIIPIGGFCNMAGEFLPGKEEELEEEEREKYLKAKKEGKCFHQKSIWQRFLVIFMGPFMNFLLAAFIFIIIFSVFGLPIDSSQTTVIGDVTPGQPAREAGLKPGDEILAINDQEVDNWQEMAGIIHNSEEQIKVRYQRNDVINETEVKLKYNEEIDANIIGIYPEVIREKIGFLRSIKLGFIQTGRIIYLTIAGFIQMISMRSAEGIGGPIMIASIVGEAAQLGINRLLNWTAVISINLGIINLVPIPALDGGRILFLFIELLRGKPIDPEKESFVHFLGFVLLIILMVFVVYKDIVRSFF
ncbi:MAG: RIP metalloprotease RseP [Halanaerobiaceae bacterium]